MMSQTRKPLDARCEHYLASAQKGADWLCQKMSSDGSFGEDAKDIAFYYKTLLALALAGRLVEASRCIGWIRNNLVMDNGAIVDKDSPWITDWRPYPAAWIIWGAKAMERADIVALVGEYLLAYHDPKWGGFFNSRQSRDAGSGIEEIVQSTMGGMACIDLGNLAIAEGVGELLGKILDSQPDIQSGLYVRVDSVGGLITELEPIKIAGSDGSYGGKDIRQYFVNASEEKQYYFSAGLPIAFLVRLFWLTQNKKYLETANGYYNFTTHCAADVRRCTTSGKLGYGLGLLYQVSGQDRHREEACEVADYLLEIQQNDGSWYTPMAYSSPEEQPLGEKVDITAEFVVWLCEIVKAIA